MERKSIVAALVMGAALAASPARAAGIIVNTLVDGSVAGACTLRDAIEAANTDTTVNGCATGAGPDTITFSVSGTIVLASRLPLIEPDSSVTIDGNGQTVIISGGGTTQVMYMLEGATLHLQNVTVANGYSATGAGVQMDGGILSVSGTTFAYNYADFFGSGGAIFASYGTVSVNNSTFIGNGAANLGGAIFSGSTLTIVNSTFSGNASVYSGGGLVNGGTATIINSTFSGNAAVGGSVGTGGISNAGTLILGNTIVANSSRGDDCGNSGTITSVGVNLIEDGSCFVAGALIGDPMLGPLANNGGVTMTHALTAASTLVIDKGDKALCATYTTDQRGSPRTVDGDGDGTAVCDLGAYEFSTLYAFSGFFAPVDNLPVVNTVKAGRAVPVTFSLGGDKGLSIFAANSPASQQIACDSGAPADVVEQTTTAGGSSLAYDPASNTYTYVWKTDKAWAGTCRQLVVQLADGTFHLASFQFK